MSTRIDPAGGACKEQGREGPHGQNVDVVAQPGKTGWLYVFNRVTGAPIWPIALALPSPPAR